MGAQFTATFSAIAVTLAQDVFEIVAPTDKPIYIRSIDLGQYSDFADAQAEILSVLIMRGHSTTGSGGAAVTPGPCLSGGDASTSTVARNNTTVATSGSPVTLFAGSWNVQSPFRWEPEEKFRHAVQPSERYVVRITVPADSLTMNGTISWEEGR